MEKKPFRSLLLLAVLAAPVATAGLITDNLVFSGGSPNPTSGSFTYDTSAQTFTAFNVTWGGVTFNFLPSANRPVYQTTGNDSFCPQADMFQVMTGGGQCNGLPLSNRWGTYPPNPPGNDFTSALVFQLFNSQAEGYVFGGSDPDRSFIASATSGTFAVAGSGVSGSIGGASPEQFYSFQWSGGAFAATAALGDLTPAEQAQDGWSFSLGTYGSSCTDQASQTLNSTNNFSGALGLTTLSAGTYCIGLTPLANNVDPTFTVTFNTPVAGLTTLQSTPEPASFFLLPGGALLIAVIYRRRSAALQDPKV